jgi:2-keto-4-pentenoate hydratase/2-oxohepta-3-ene-1,7-dioic acid hydratase in catechol pathway
MRLASFRAGTRIGFGRVEDGHLLDLGHHLAGMGDLLTFLEQATPRDWDIARTADGPALELSTLSLLPPLWNARKLFGVGVNFRSHAADTGRPVGKEPLLFLRLADSLVGAEQAVEVPASSQCFECEGELAVVIGKTAWQVRPQDALQHVAGYSCFMDGSARDWQARTNAVTAKNFPRSGSFGPWLHSTQALDPGALTVQTFVNDRMVQSGCTSEMVFPVADLIAYISAFTPLMPGDVVVTGTPGKTDRSQSLALRPGDRVRVDIAGVGSLCNPVVQAQPCHT